jgi:hypothetical protein
MSMTTRERVMHIRNTAFALKQQIIELRNTPEFLNGGDAPYTVIDSMVSGINQTAFRSNDLMLRYLPAEPKVSCIPDLPMREEILAD